MSEWENYKLKDISKIIGGGTPKTKIKKYWGDDLVWLSPTDLPKIGDITEVNNSIRKITKIGLDNSSAKLLPIGTVSYSSRASIGKIGIAKVELATNQGFKNFICNQDKLYNRFLAYALKNYTEDIVRLSNSTTFKEVSTTSIKNFKIPLPSLTEQRRIVRKLDALFAEIDASLALIDKNIEQAETLKLSVLDEEFSKGVENEEWRVEKLKEIAFTKSGATPRRSTKIYWEKGKIPWLKSGELNDNKNITKNSEFITQQGLDNSSATLFPKGTLLMAMYGATAGKLGILGMEACTNQAVCSIQNTKNLFVEEYLYFYLLMIREKIIRDSFGGAQPNISKKYIDNLQIPIPIDKKEQVKIVNKLNTVFQKTDQLIQEYTQKRANLEALKSSLLDRAFKGEL